MYILKAHGSNAALGISYLMERRCGAEVCKTVTVSGPPLRQSQLRRALERKDLKFAARLCGRDGMATIFVKIKRW